MIKRGGSEECDNSENVFNTIKLNGMISKVKESQGEWFETFEVGITWSGNDVSRGINK